MSAPIPLAVLVEALAVMDAVADLDERLDAALFLRLLHAKNRMDGYIAPMLAAQQVGASA